MNPEILALEKEADALRINGNYEEAIAKLQQVLVIDENFVRATWALAYFIITLGIMRNHVTTPKKRSSLNPTIRLTIPH